MSIALLGHQGTQAWPGWALLMRGRSPLGRSSRYLALMTQTVLTRIDNVLSVDAVLIPAYDVPMPLSYHLTHWVLMTPYGDRDLDQHWLRRWLDAWASVSHMHKNGCSSWCECSFLITSNLFQFAFCLTLNVRVPSYLDLTRSISWLLMPWLLVSPGHQQPWYWLCRICKSWSYLRKDFKYMCQINVE